MSLAIVGCSVDLEAGSPAGPTVVASSTTTSTTTTPGTTSTTSVPAERAPALACAVDEGGAVLLRAVELYNEIGGEPILALVPGDGVVPCGESRGWYLYAYAPPGEPVDCVPLVPSRTCVIGWSPAPLELEFPG